MSPMGFAIHRQAKVRQSMADEASVFDDDWEPNNIDPTIRPVPIWLCVFLVVSYIIGGAFLFSKWEKWNYLGKNYFKISKTGFIGFPLFLILFGQSYHRFCILLFHHIDNHW